MNKRKILFKISKNPIIIFEYIMSWVNNLKFLNVGFSRKRNQLAQPIIYIRTPKTASSSVIQSLKLANLYYEVHPNRTNDLSITNITEKSNFYVLVINATKVPWFIENYNDLWKVAYKWAVVREPYSKTVSAWRFLENLREKELDELLVNPPRPVNNEYNRDYVHFTLSFSEMLTFDNKIYTDRILKYETLQEDLEKLSFDLNLKLNKLPHFNKTLGKMKKSDELSLNQKKLIQEFFKDDFINFNYQA